MKEKEREYREEIIKVVENRVVMKCPGCGHYNLLREMVWEKGIAKCRGINCDWRFGITWGGEKKEKILKTRPKGKEGFHPTKYGIPQGKDREGHWKPWKYRNLLIGDIYDIETDEPGQEILFKAVFLGWRRETIEYAVKDIPDSHYYIAIFKAVGNIMVETDYSLTITKSKEEGEEKDE